jgi:Type II secretion system (T2SS), protein M subtype b
MMSFWTQLSERDRRALSLLLVALSLAGLIAYWPDSTATGPGLTGEPAGEDELELVQRRRLRLQQIASTIPGKQELLKRAQAELAEREKGMIVADTAAQAQAQLVQILRQVGRQQNPPLELRGTEGGAVTALGDSYGQVMVSVVLDCPVEALVNYLADLTRQKEILATHDIRISSTQSKQKLLSVRLTVTGVVPKRLAPEKKGGRS